MEKTKRAIPKTGNYVYKFVYNDEIIYIGKCDTQSFNRVYAHGKNGDNIDPIGWDEINESDIYYTPLFNNIMSDVIESALIKKFQPKYNKSKTTCDWNGFDVPNLEWIQIRDGRKATIEKLKAKNEELHKENNKLKNENYKLRNENDGIKNRSTEKVIEIAYIQEGTNTINLNCQNDNINVCFSFPEILMFYQHYPINGLKFYSHKINDSFKKDIAEIEFCEDYLKVSLYNSLTMDNGDEINKSPDIKFRIEKNEKLDAYHQFTLSYFNMWIPSTNEIFPLIKSFYVDLKEEMTRYLQSTTFTVGEFVDMVKNKWSNQIPSNRILVRLKDFNANVCFENHVQDDNLDYMYDKNAGTNTIIINGEFPPLNVDIPNSLSMNADTFASQFGNLQCISMESNTFIKILDFISRRVRNVDEILSKLDLNYDLYNQIHCKINFKLYERYFEGSISRENDDLRFLSAACFK